MFLHKLGFFSVTALVTIVLFAAVMGAQAPERHAESAQTSPKPAPSNPSQDELPAGARMRFGVNRFRHEGGVPAALVFSPDGKSLFAVGESRVLYTWESRSGKLIRKDQFETPTVRSDLVLSADAKQIACVSSMETTVWDLPLNKQRPFIKLPTMLGAKGVFTTDGTALVIAGISRQHDMVQLWDLKTGKLQKEMPLEQPPEVALPAAQAGTAPRITVPIRRQPPYKLDISPDGKVIVGVSFDSAIFWDLNGKLLRTYPQDALFHAFSSDGKALAYSNGGGVFLWDLATGQQQRRFVVERNAPERMIIRNGLVAGMPLAFSPDGKLLAASATDAVVVWEAASAKQILSFTHLGSGIQLSPPILCFSPDGKSLVEGGESSVLRIWDLESGKEKMGEVGHRSAVTEIAISPDGSKIATSALRDADVRIWDVGTGTRDQLLNVQAPQARGLLFSRDGQSLIAARSNIYVWNAASGEKLQDLVPPRIPNSSVLSNRQSIALLPDGTTLAALTMQIIRAADAAGGRRQPAGAAGKRPQRAGQQRARYELQLTTWDIFTGKLLNSQRTSSQQNSEWLLSNDGSLRALFREQGCKIYENKSGKMVAFLDSGNQTMLIAFSADGQKLAALCGQGIQEPLSAIWWDVVSGKELGRVQTPLRVGLTIESSKHAGLAFSPDGKILATGAQASGGIQLWDVSTGKEIGRFTGYGDTVTSLKFTPSGRQLVSGLVNGLVLLWDVDKATAPPQAPRS